MYFFQKRLFMKIFILSLFLAAEFPSAIPPKDPKAQMQSIEDQSDEVCFEEESDFEDMDADDFEE